MTEIVLRLLPLVGLLLPLILPPLLAYRGIGRSRLNYLGTAILAGLPGALLYSELDDIAYEADFAVLSIVTLVLLALATGSLAAIFFWRPRATVQ